MLSPRNFLYTSFTSSKKGWKRVENYVYLSKMYVIKSDFFCVFLLEHLDVFLMFILLPAMLDMFFSSQELPILWPNKAGDGHCIPSSHRVRITNQWNSFKPNKPKRQLIYWEVKSLGDLQLLAIHSKIHFRTILHYPHFYLDAVDFCGYFTVMIYTELPQCWGTPCSSKSMNRAGTILFARN